MPITPITPGGCIDAVAALLLTLPGITGGAGQVHKRRRIVRDEAAVKAVLTGTGGKVNVWMVSPANANTTVTQRHPGFAGIGVQGGASGNVHTTFQFQIEAYYQLDDAAASEVTFRDLLWLVADTINSYGTLAIPGVVMQLPADIDQFGFIAVAGGGLYHYGKISCGWSGRTR